MSKPKEYIYLLDQINVYRKKYYVNMLLKGCLIGAALLLGSFLTLNFIEHIVRFSSTLRGMLFIAFIAVVVYTLFFLIIGPVFYLLNINKPLSNATLANQIGNFFPNIKDKLLNTIQLASAENNADTSLLTASILQKSKELTLVNFADAINLKENRQYLKYLLIPIAIITMVLFVNPSVFRSTERIVFFNKSFQEPAPFTFNILNKNLTGIKNEDFELKLQLTGSTLPDEVFVISNNRKLKMDLKQNHAFTLLFPNIQKETEFSFTAAGFTSNTYKIKLNTRPNLLSFKVHIDYPAYLNKTSESFQNVGNLAVPEGTKIRWDFNAVDTDSIHFVIDEKEKYQVKKTLLSDFVFDKTFKNSSNYELVLRNKNSSNADKISYFVNVVNDKFPQISLEQIKDTSLYNYIGIGGNISDDYGLTNFTFNYRIKSSKNTNFNSTNIPFNKASNSQTFFHQVNLSTLNLNKGDQLEYFLQVTDNDGVNGKKSTKTTLLNFGMPTNLEFEKDVEKETEKSENKFEEILKKSKEFKKEIEKLENDLKKKNDFDFQDKKEFDELIKKKEALQKDIQELQKQLQELKEKQNRFDKQSPELNQKMEKLQKLLDELMKNADDKTLEKLKEDLQKNLDEKSIDKLSDYKKEQRNLDKNIDRMLNLFKNLQLKQKVEQVAKDLEKLADKQEDLANKTEKETKENQELTKQQEKLSKEFEEKKEQLKKIEKDSKELKKEIDTKKEKQEEIEKEQKKAEKEMKDGENAKASENQKKAAKSMRNLSGQLMEGSAGAEMKQLDLDLDALRDILENLLKISHEQEGTMKSFKNISVSDPRFIALSQQQLKIADDSKIIEDSLYTLAKRVMQIEGFVTEEVTKMKNEIDESIKFIKERKIPQAASKQQFSMTAMNNLALMLSDTFKQMQQMMAAMIPGSGSGSKGNTPSEGMGEQQKSINQKMQKLGNGGMGGQQLSEELAKIANEQSKLRKQLKEMQDQLNGTEPGKKIGNTLNDLQKKMDESENDLVNKRINPELFKRQKEIETRLLEAEKAIKEQELDPKRKSNTGITFNRISPPELEKFKKEKEKQVELLRTTPPNYTPFYKQQTDYYFKKIN